MSKGSKAHFSPSGEAEHQEEGEAKAMGCLTGEIDHANGILRISVTIHLLYLVNNNTRSPTPVYFQVAHTPVSVLSAECGIEAR
jgi:hypothetical protein